MKSGLEASKGEAAQRAAALAERTATGVGARTSGSLALALGAMAAKGLKGSGAGSASSHIGWFSIDQGLIAMGVAAAVGSAGFAGFMMSRDNSRPVFGGIEHLMIFSQPIGGSRSHASPQQSELRPASMDYDAIGSIERPQRKASAEDAPGKQAGSARAGAKGYWLRAGDKGALMAVGPKGAFVAAPGVMLPDAGRVLTVQNRNGRWLVTTEQGVIAEQD